MKKLEVEINISGYPVGTLNWFNHILDNSKFVILNRDNEEPAIYLKTEIEDGTHIHRLLCKRATDDTKYAYMLTEDGYACIYPEETYYVAGFEKCHLTPACKQAIKELIMKAKDIFAEWWENDGKLKE